MDRLSVSLMAVMSMPISSEDISSPNTTNMPVGIVGATLQSLWRRLISAKNRAYYCCLQLWFPIAR